MSRRWIVIETGSNQKLVFQTNKQRLNISASRLIWRVGFEWIPEAARAAGVSDEDHVVKASGLGYLFATQDAGRKIIEAVTTRAAVEAPDLEIWGVVGDVDVDEDLSNLGLALGDAQRRLAQWRIDKPSPIIRDATLPYTQLCAFTGRPAVCYVDEGERGSAYAASEGVAKLWTQAQDARKALVERLSTGAGDSCLVEAAVVTYEDLQSGDGVANDGWVGVLHADGNGIGDIFTNLRRVESGNELRELIRKISETLEQCAWQSVTNAIETIAKGAACGDSAPPTNWVLPILVGGDDITVLLDGRYAFDFSSELAEEFERLVNGKKVITETLELIAMYQEEWVESELIPRATAPERISLACGLVYTKPHHPFSHSVDFAEQLTASAKSVKLEGRSALDMHVLHESALRNLDDVRAPMVFEGRALWAGPIVLGCEDHSRHKNHLREAMRLIRPAESNGGREPIPSGVLHDLRVALTTGSSAELNAVKARATEVSVGRGYESSLALLLGEHLEPTGGPAFSRILTAMELLDVNAEEK